MLNLKSKCCFFALLGIVFFACISKPSQEPELILYNAILFTAESNTEEYTAFAVKNGLFLALGKDEEILKLKGPNTVVIDAHGQFIMPGLIEGHGHFAGFGQSLLNLDFSQDTSWQQIVEKVQKSAEQLDSGTWITGRGWHQEKWKVQEENLVNSYPTHHRLSQATPNHPVVLFHSSGHSLFANQKAMEIAGISEESLSPSGGVIVKDAKGKPIGVFEERAMNAIQLAYQKYLDTLTDSELSERWKSGILLAQSQCLSHGITSFHDAGTTFEDLRKYQEMSERGELSIKLYCMIRHDLGTLEKNKHLIPYFSKNGHLVCRAIKSELDGALGVFGAWKLRPYADKPGYTGQNTTKVEDLEKIADFALKKQMQLCVHAIGDRANREFLNICDKKFEEIPNHKALRWRSEHAQHLDTADIHRFSSLGIIASMQGIHCTSDAPFVVKRLGIERSKTGAYAWRSLLDKGVIIANGTDVPVESINPFECIYASVTRKRKDSDEAFFPEQAMTRKEALQSYTINNAYAAFEENIKGSIKVGKVADFLILDKNLLTCAESEIHTCKVIATYINGIERYRAKIN